MTPTLIEPERVNSVSDSALLRTFLAGHDALCPVCQYGLRGVETERCPECGSPIHLGVVSEHARLGPWLLATMSFAFGIGFDGVVWAIMMASGLIASFPAYSTAPRFWRMLGGMSFLLVASSAGLALMLRNRWRWQRAQVRVQKRRAVMIFVLVGLGHAVVGAGIIVLNL